MLTLSDYHPPYWLRNAHVQSIFAASDYRRAIGSRLLRGTGAITTSHILQCGNGARLQGFHSTVPGVSPLGLVVLFHGWEGSSESSYIRFAASQLLAAGFDVFRLNFRDHGNTHGLNAGLFLFNGLTEVVQAVGEIALRFSPRPLFAAGYSLGGSFALRLARVAVNAGTPLRHVVAVCPMLDPAESLRSLELSLPIYYGYFMRKWRASLRKKRLLFPDMHAYNDALLKKDMRTLTRLLIVPQTGFSTLEEYFDDYSIADDRMLQSQVPISILAAADDPVIPVNGFQKLRLPGNSRVDISPWGGHCGFLLNRSTASFAEHWLTEQLLGAVAEAKGVAAPAFFAGDSEPATLAIHRVHSTWNEERLGV